MDEGLGDHCRAWARWRPNAPALKFRDEVTTWAELDHLTDGVAAGLRAAGLRRGDVVGVLMSNRPEFVHLLIAALKRGVALAPLNTRLTAAELVHPIVDSRMRLVVTERALLPNLELAAAAVGDLRIVLADGPTDGIEGFDVLRGDARCAPVVDIAASDIAFLCYTSGTTGFPKGALLSHRAVRAVGIGKVLGEGITWRDRLLLPIPMAFTGGSVSNYTQMSLLPGALCVLEPDWDPHRAVHLLASERITMMNPPPVFLETMAAEPDFDRLDLSSLWTVATGGAPVKRGLLERWQGRGVQMTQTYGLTEAAGAVTCLNNEDASTRLGWAGRPLLNVRLKIVDPSGAELPIGEPGEILVSGPTVMSGYHGSPELTAAALRDGWLHTGDAGLVDDEGCLKVVDRVKDMFISGGINVFPAEIERSLAPVLGDEEYVVVGVPHERWGEVPLLVVADGASLDLDVVRAHSEAHLADYKRPRAVVRGAGALPRGMSGKVQKRDLVARYRQLPEHAEHLRIESTTARSRT